MNRTHAVRLTLAAAVLLAGLTTSTPATGAPTTETQAAPAVSIDTAGFPAAKPAAERAAVNIPSPSARKKKVFAMYFTALPLSYDNKPASADQYACYTSPTCQELYVKYGGIMRDRPVPRNPLSGNWRLADAKTEIKQAKAAGLDGFLLDMLNLSDHNDVDGNYKRLHNMMKAAQSVDKNFKLMLMPDLSPGGADARLTPSQMAAQLAAFNKYSAVYRTGKKMVIAPFNADLKTPTYWKSVMSSLKSNYRIDSVLLPILNTDTAKNFNGFLKISWGISEWGVHDPTQIAGRVSSLKLGARARKAGKKWMQSIRVQDSRPRDAVFDEAANSETIKASWKAAKVSKADLAFLVSWNDYYETTSFAPSVQHGWAVLDINAFYQSEFQTGKKPAVRRDAVYISHRVQAHNLKPSLKAYSSSTIARLRGVKLKFKKSYFKPARNTVEVVTMLTKKTKVKVAIGGKLYTYTAKAGVSAKLFPLRTGYVSAAIYRKSSKTKKYVRLGTVATNEKVVGSRSIQDLGYRFASSLRRLPRRS